jgi:SAM-dependent methyltransferase
MERHDVFRSDRIRVTERLINSYNAGRVLEIGAGDYSFDYLRQQGQVSWTKVDFAPPCDEICDLNSDALVLPFDDNNFDLIICTEVLEHLLWPHHLLHEAHRVLSVRGHIIISVPNCTSLSYRIAWLLGHVPSCASSGNLPPELGSNAYRLPDGSTIGGHVIDFTLRRIQNLLNFSGFTVEQIKGSGIIWHRQLMPAWLVPATLSSNIICLARKSNA